MGWGSFNYRKASRVLLVFVLAAALTGVPTIALAHEPIFVPADVHGAHGAPATAFRLPNQGNSTSIRGDGLAVYAEYRTNTLAGALAGAPTTNRAGALNQPAPAGSSDVPVDWYALAVQPGAPLRVRLAIPRLERLASFRPSLAIVGPGLPPAPAGLPFAVPPGQGAIVMPGIPPGAPSGYGSASSGLLGTPTAPVGTPTAPVGTRSGPTGTTPGPAATTPGPAGTGPTGASLPEFRDQLTQTILWLLPEATAMPSGGEVLLAVWVPAGQSLPTGQTDQPGKYVLAVGALDRFPLSEWARFPEWIGQVRAFHEVSSLGVTAALYGGAALFLLVMSRFRPRPAASLTRRRRSSTRAAAGRRGRDGAGPYRSVE